MSASGLTAADPVTATSGVAAAAVALPEDETGRDPQVPVVEGSTSAEELPAATKSISGGEKRPREEEGDVGADSSNEEPPTKKAAGEGEQVQETGNQAEVTRNAIEMKRSADETAPGINGAPPIGSSISAIPFGPAAPDRPLDHHRWGAEAGPFRHTLKVPQHCVAQIIGRGGANLTSIRNTSRCHIECDQYTKEQGYSLFHIDGQNDEDLQRAIRAIERQTKPMEPLEGEIQHIIQVPDDRVGDILGPRGCVVKVIADRTGCRIDMQQRGLQRGEARACRIIGTPAEVQAGVKMVEGIRDNLIDVKALIREFEELNPNFRRDESELRSPAGWGSGGKGSGGWDQSYGMRTEYVAHAPYGAFGGQDLWSHLLPASGPIDRAVIDVPAECAGLVIGRGGENVKGLKSQCSLSECQIEKGTGVGSPSSSDAIIDED
ncbi:hypothetical protein Pmar_PMAR017378 [Perkinsus marinus ATCC 50983]|uniref:K Homology domain-containing protein n=1 Tax=Perkinsus marinus (strain ATCC 50983 / TXsc) TaxID=423536 RepID=C5LHF4_PERM5|nr:hypothetical protein Pmar_PMAR017378 [Perkinsus marinus ATCC 50983]EER03963.1 hypothetical protein Pmar_PMAR017378 [Perkinsus marinus ATCC 50983]|eukprot:XP_002772147.1 hypothetical protein Pmar_PMAR017378 [Perkinsus marinus ATCC 50983]